MDLLLSTGENGHRTHGSVVVDWRNWTQRTWICCCRLAKLDTGHMNLLLSTGETGHRAHESVAVDWRNWTQGT